MDESSTRRRAPAAGAAAGLSMPVYDYSEWPLLVLRMPPSVLSAAEFDAHLDACGKPYMRGQPFCWLIDMRNHPPLPATQRKAVGDGITVHIERHPGLVRGMATVVRSPLQRHVATAIEWIARPPYPCAVFEDVATAKTWLREQMGARPTGRGT